MFTLYTTEDNLIQICLEEDFWFDIIQKQETVYIKTSSDNGEWDNNNPILTNLHRSGTKIEVNNQLDEEIRNDHSKVYSLSNPVYLINIEKNDANEIEEEYGVICKPIEESNNIALVEQGWEIDTADDYKKQSWNYFLSDIHVPMNAIVIVDRYFFSSEKNKTKATLNETLDDSYSNLEQILEALLPQKAKDGVITITLVYDHEQLHKDEILEFKDLVTKTNKIKKKINRPYAYTLELISLNSDCYQYKETHDRFIISNYFIVNATHKIKAYRPNNVSLVNQNIYFNYLFSKGIKPNDKSSMPITTQTRVLKAISESISTSKKSIKYGCNGITSDNDNFSIKNRLFS